MTKSGKNNENEETYISPPPPSPPSPERHPINTPPSEHVTDRIFTLAELKQAEEGKYSWDETGCVFEINSDGSVTIVGHFDPTELLVDPVQELYDKLIEDGLTEMLPSIWCFVGSNNDIGAFIVYDDTVLFSEDYYSSIEGIREATFSYLSDSSDISTLIKLICLEKKGYLFLLPSNEKEFILAMGAQSCINRNIGNGLNVRISSPAVMGALWSGILNNSDKLTKISYAFSKDDNYSCCNMTVEDGVYQTNQLLVTSIIQPADITSAVDRIARSCLLISKVLSGDVKNALLIDIVPFPISAMVIEDGRVKKIYDLIHDSTSTPTRQAANNFSISQGQTVSLLIGSTEIISNVADEMGLTDSITNMTIEINANMIITLIVETSNETHSLNIGNLIG